MTTIEQKHESVGLLVLIEDCAVRLGWGDPAKLAAMEVELEALASAIQERRVREWEAFKQANARVFPERTAPPIAKDNPLWVLAGCGMDESHEETVARVQHYYEDR